MTMIDPAPCGLTRVLWLADQLVLVIPASPEAATALAHTQQWLTAHGYDELAARAATVVNGVSRRGTQDVPQAESGARGRRPAIAPGPLEDQASPAAIRMQDAEVHLRIAHRAYPAQAWATGLDGTSDGGPGWRDYLEQSYQHVWAKDFWGKEIYLGVRLGQRGVRAQLSGGVLSQFAAAYGKGERGLGLVDEAIAGAEISKWTESAERLGRALNASALAARHATSREIPWLLH